VVVVAGWADRDTDPVARDQDSAWAAVEDRAAGEPVPAVPAGVVALALAEAAEVLAPACGNQELGQGAEVAPGQVAALAVGVDQAVEVEPVAEVGLVGEQASAVEAGLVVVEELGSVAADQVLVVWAVQVAAEEQEAAAPEVRERAAELRPQVARPFHLENG
jgi:hypothetical protein